MCRVITREKRFGIEHLNSFYGVSLHFNPCQGDRNFYLLRETDLSLDIADMTTVTATQTATTHERTHGTPNNTSFSSIIAPLETLISLEVF